LPVTHACGNAIKLPGAMIPGAMIPGRYTGYINVAHLVDTQALLMSPRWGLKILGAMLKLVFKPYFKKIFS